jgi:hypothetical protein
MSISITSGLFKGEHIEFTVKVLDIFNDANTKRPIKTRVHYKEFYNDAINKEVNLREHLLLWLQQKEKSRMQNVPYNKYKYFTICNYPFILDSANKSDMIRIHNKNMQEVNQRENIMDLLLQPGLSSMYLFLEVRRDHILEDTLNRIINPGLNFKKPLRVQFVGEPGIDEGGVRKEFF